MTLRDLDLRSNIDLCVETNHAYLSTQGTHVSTHDTKVVFLPKTFILTFLDL